MSTIATQHSRRHFRSARQGSGRAEAMVCGRSARCTGICSHGREQGSGIAITNSNGAIVDDHRRATAPPSSKRRRVDLCQNRKISRMRWVLGTLVGFHRFLSAPMDVGRRPKTIAIEENLWNPLGTRLFNIYPDRYPMAQYQEPPFHWGWCTLWENESPTKNARPNEVKP